MDNIFTRVCVTKLNLILAPFFNLCFVLDLERISYTRDLIVIAVQSINSTVGHNLGGEHPFYDEEIVKRGDTGGIMDYG